MDSQAQMHKTPARCLSCDHHHALTCLRVTKRVRIVTYKCVPMRTSVWACLYDPGICSRLPRQGMRRDREVPTLTGQDREGPKPYALNPKAEGSGHLSREMPGSAPWSGFDRR